MLRKGSIFPGQRVKAGPYRGISLGIEIRIQQTAVLLVNVCSCNAEAGRGKPLQPFLVRVVDIDIGNAVQIRNEIQTS